MSTNFQILRWVAAALVAAGTLTGCSALTGGDNPQAGGDVLAGDGEVALPITARYGYLELTVVSAAPVDQAPEDLATSEPATYFAVEVEVANPVDEAGFTIPPEVFVLVADGQEYRGALEGGGSIEVGQVSTAAETLWFALPEDATATTPSLLVNESGYQPLSISLTEPASAPEEVPVPTPETFETECERVAFGDGVASYNSPTAAGTQRPGPGVSSLGRAAEGQVLVTYQVSASESCSDVGNWYYIQHPVYGLLNEVWMGDRVIEATQDLDQDAYIDDATVDGYLAVALPEDSIEPLVFEWWNWYTDPYTKTPTNAPLDGIEALIGSK